MIDLAPYSLEKLREDGEMAVFRGMRPDDGARVLVVAAASEHPSLSSINRIKHAYSLRDELDSSWAIRPLELLNPHGIPALLLDDPGGDFLDGVLRRSPSLEELLRLSIAITKALGGVHERQLIHRDVKPANIVANAATGAAWLTGFGLTSRLARYRQLPDPPDVIAGTLAYMAPEQTGRMNRLIDSRSDLYSLGVTLYEMFVGALPFEATDAMGWVHCHIARLPVAPNLRRNEIPEPLSAIILKLLAKTPEERYQTAAGVEVDLRHVLSAVETRGAIASFPLGARDVSTRLLIPEKLYGREREVELLLAAFERVVSQGTMELALVSGYSGVGKSSVVNELHKVLLSRGLFAVGKFDQYQRDIPYATLAQAFGTLVRQILGKSDAEVAAWRDSLQGVLGPHGQLITNLVPEVELIVGKQPPVPELPPEEAKHRFQRLLQRFIGVFARPEHPLALFLDDLQWLDTATLELIEQLIVDPEVRHLLLVGAYRDNEVDPGHPFMRTLEKIRAVGTRVHQIVLLPLELDDLNALAADALRCSADHSRSLAQLVYEKTGGNPFFAIQFIIALAEEDLILFDSAASAWKWDPARIVAKGYTGNVVELMIAKLNRLPEATQNSLKQLACVGNSAGTATLNLIYGESEEELHAALWEAVRLGLTSRSDNTYSFAHDRIQQAAYSLIPEEHRGNVHLRIGRVLLESMAADQLAEHLFDVANQLSRGAGLLIDHNEKMRVATVHLRAGRKAKASAAYASALTYFSAGKALLDETDWISRYELTFSLWFECAECEFLTGHFDKAEQLIGELLPRGATKVDEAAVYHLKVQLHVRRSDNQQAVFSALTGLRLLGIDMAGQPTPEQAQSELETLGRALDACSIEGLIDLPLLSDPDLQAAMRLFSVMTPPAYLAGFNVTYLLCRQINISIKYGMSGDSAYACACLGTILGQFFHRHNEGFRFAKLAGDLVEKHGFLAQKAKVYGSLAIVSVWTQPIATAIEFAQKGFLAAIEGGDATNACVGMGTFITYLLVRNDPLDSLWGEADMALGFARKAGYRDAADIIASQQRFIATMQGRTATLSTFNDAGFQEETFEAQFTGGRSPVMICWYWILKLKARFLSGDFADALAAADKAKPWLDASAGQIQQVDYFYYAALTMSALYESASADQQQTWRKLLSAHRDQLSKCAENYPPTFADKHALVSAEIARIEARDADAMRLYEQAIRSAHEHGFVQNEGLAHEVAARFYAERGFKTIADAYVRNARYCYLRWGADGKVRQLDASYPRSREETRAPDAKSTIDESVEHLDLTTVMKVSEAVSGEIELGTLINTLMRTALEHAGAERGLLILLQGADYRIEAEATVISDAVAVVLREASVSEAAVPESVFQFVVRTKESVLLPNAFGDSSFATDSYIHRHRARSVLCLPLLKQARLLGVLYLENNLATNVFTPARTAVLKLLASQAAISLENTRLYDELREREARVSRLISANIIGIFTWNLDGRILEANEAFGRIVGYGSDELTSGNLRWNDLMPDAWDESDDQVMSTLLATGVAPSFEAEYLKKDGTRVPVLIGAARFEGRPAEGVAFVLDLTERKAAEEALGRAQMELAQVTRATTMGVLAASIGHEVSQPISGIITNAGTCLRMLAADPPNVEGARETAKRMIRDGNRAAEVVTRLRALFGKKDIVMESVDLNDAAREVIALSLSELQRGRVVLQAEFADGLAPVLGDRMQLQQVILNLLLNASEAMSGIEGPRRLVIKTEPDDGNHIRLSVQDAGVGLDPQSIDKLFDTFYTTKRDGMGIGLSVSRSIIERHQGRLWAAANDGPGATFSFSLLAGLVA
jgi:PAS domain S-box-containing protein